MQQKLSSSLLLLALQAMGVMSCSLLICTPCASDLACLRPASWPPQELGNKTVLLTEATAKIAASGDVEKELAELRELKEDVERREKAQAEVRTAWLAGGVDGAAAAQAEQRGELARWEVQRMAAAATT